MADRRAALTAAEWREQLRRILPIVFRWPTMLAAGAAILASVDAWARDALDQSIIAYARLEWLRLHADSAGIEWGPDWTADDIRAALRQQTSGPTPGREAVVASCDAILTPAGIAYRIVEGELTRPYLLADDATADDITARSLFLHGGSMLVADRTIYIVVPYATRDTHQTTLDVLARDLLTRRVAGVQVVIVGADGETPRESEDWTAT